MSKTQREKFLERMDTMIPWRWLVKERKKYYPKHNRGRPSYPLETILRFHCMQRFYNLADLAMEGTSCELESIRRFAELQLSEAVPDGTTILNFRYFLECHKFGDKIPQEVIRHLKQQGLMLRESSSLDANVNDARRSTKNDELQRDSETHQTRKSNQWHFGLKMHIGVDDTLGQIPSLETTPANTHDLRVIDQMLHAEEERAFGDSVYQGLKDHLAAKKRKAKHFITLGPSRRKALDPDNPEAHTEKQKASMRAKVEHLFFYIKRMWV